MLSDSVTSEPENKMVFPIHLALFVWMTKAFEN